MINDHIASTVSIEMDDFENVQFNQSRMIKVHQFFGQERTNVFNQLNKALQYNTFTDLLE